MLAVQVFGGLAVERDGAQCGGAAARRKTLALLALLAGAGRRGLSRDKLTAYLWPESDTEHGRGLLKQACYALRDRKSTRLNSSHLVISYAVFCLKKKKTKT